MTLMINVGGVEFRSAWKSDDKLSDLLIRNWVTTKS